MRLFQKELLLYKKNWDKWNIVTLDTNYGFRACTFRDMFVTGSEKKFIVTGNTAERFESFDCINWVKYSPLYPITRQITRLSNNADYAIGYDNSETPNLNTIYYWTGSAWRHSTMLSGYTLEDIEAKEDVVAIGNNQGTTRYGYLFTKSYSGSSWTTKKLDMSGDTSTYKAWTGICLLYKNTAQKRFKICGRGSFGHSATNSTDINTWSVSGTNLSSKISRLIYNSDIGTIYAGSDGCIVLETNNNVVTTLEVGEEDFTGIAFGNGRFVAVTINGKTTESKDGLNWSALEDTGIGGEVYDVTFGNGKFLIVSTNGKIAYKI